MHYSRHSGIKRMVKTMLPDDSDEYEKRAKGGPVLTTVTPIKLNPSQPYMYIDLNVPIRAVYFPLAQKPSTVFPDLCSYLMVDFRMRQGVRMHNMVDQDDIDDFEEEWVDPERPLPGQAVAFDHYRGLANLEGCKYICSQYPLDHALAHKSVRESC